MHAASSKVLARSRYWKRLVARVRRGTLHKYSATALYAAHFSHSTTRAATFYLGRLRATYGETLFPRLYARVDVEALSRACIAGHSMKRIARDFNFPTSAAASAYVGYFRNSRGEEMFPRRYKYRVKEDEGKARPKITTWKQARARFNLKGAER